MIALTTKFLVRLYQYTLGQALPNSCRFQPTCSEYAIQAVEKHGVRGLWLAAGRILRCHPWGGYCYDPVPPTTRETEKKDAGHKDARPAESCAAQNTTNLSYVAARTENK